MLSTKTTKVWNHSVPNTYNMGFDLQLLTITGVSVLGRWTGEFGEFFVGWTELLGASRAQLKSYDTPCLDDIEHFTASTPSPNHLQ